MEKKYTEEDIENIEEYSRIEGENNILKRILEQKLGIELIPKFNTGLVPREK